VNSHSPFRALNTVFLKWSLQREEASRLSLTAASTHSQNYLLTSLGKRERQAPLLGTKRRHWERDAAQCAALKPLALGHLCQESPEFGLLRSLLRAILVLTQPAMEPLREKYEGDVEGSTKHVAEACTSLRESTSAWLNGLVAADATADEWLSYVEANVPGISRQLGASSSALKEDTAPHDDIMWWWQGRSAQGFPDPRPCACRQSLGPGP